MGLREDIEAEDLRYRASLIEYCARTPAIEFAMVESLAEESKTRQRAIFSRYWPDQTAIGPRVDTAPSVG